MNKALNILWIVEIVAGYAFAFFWLGRTYEMRRKAKRAELHYKREMNQIPKGAKEDLLHVLEDHVLPDMLKKGAPEEIIQAVKETTDDLKKELGKQ